MPTLFIRVGFFNYKEIDKRFFVIWNSICKFEIINLKQKE